jgi:hypothetical protein
MADIEGRYEEFAQALREGGFGIPVDPAAWPAELVAAHVIMRNDELIEAARAVRAGHQPAFDVEATKDGDALRELLIRTGSLSELADEVERSASDLQAAYDLLGEDQRGTPVPIGSQDAEPIGPLIEKSAGAHLSEHLDQLLELRD